MLVKDAARLAAERTLSQYWDDTFPVDPVGIAEQMGLSVFISNLTDDLSGAIIVDEESKDIFVSAREPFERQTFTCAHELGHFVERADANDSEYSFTDTRAPGSYDLHEFYADEFAGNLMMPRKKFVDLHDRGMSRQDLAAYFGVSRAAVGKRIDRLKKDGIINA